MPRLHGTPVALRCRERDGKLQVEVHPHGFDDAVLFSSSWPVLDHDPDDLVALKRACAAFNAEMAKAKQHRHASAVA